MKDIDEHAIYNLLMTRYVRAIVKSQTCVCLCHVTIIHLSKDRNNNIILTSEYTYYIKSKDTKKSV